MPVSLDAAAGRKALVTLNLAYNPTSSAQLAALSTFVDSCAAVGLHADFCLWPRPGVLGLTNAQYKAGLSYYGPVIKSAGFGLVALLGITASATSLTTFTNYYPGGGVVTALAGTYDAATYAAGVALDPYAALADADNIPFGLQIGVNTSAVTQAQGEGYMAYLGSFMQSRYLAGKTNGDVAWLDSPPYVLVSGSYLLTPGAGGRTDYQVLYDTLTVPPSGPPAGGLPAPGNVQVTGITATTVDLAWDAVPSAASYIVTVNGNPLLTSTSTAVTVAGLAPATLYTITVAAADSAGVVGASSAAVQATTQAQGPPPPPPPVRRDWLLIAGPPSGGYGAAIAQVTAPAYTWRLTDRGEVTFTVNATNGDDAGLSELATDVHVLRGGQELGRMRLTGAADDWSTGAHLSTWTGISYRGILDRRILYSSNRLQWYIGVAGSDVQSPIDIGDIVFGVIKETQGNPGGDLGITKGQGFPFGAVAAKTANAGDTVAQIIDDLAYVDVGGFDWDITPRDQAQLTVDLWPVARGTDRGITLQRGDGLTQEAWTRTSNTDAWADGIRMTGTGSAVAEVSAAGIATMAQGRWDAVLQTGEQDAARVAAVARLILASNATVVPSYVIPLVPDTWDGPDHIWIGDTIRVRPNSGRLTAVETLRVLELAAVPAADGEQITLTVGAVRPDLRRDFRRLVRELTRARVHRRSGRHVRPGIVPA